MMKKMLYIGAIAMVAFVVASWVKPPEYRLERRLHVVRAGQTVWGIATKWQSQQDERMSTGEFVHRIYKENKLPTGKDDYIQPGDRLIIPLSLEVREKK